MTALAPVRHVVLKPLPVQMTDGERLILQPGEDVPTEIMGPWVATAIEAGKVAAAPSLERFTDAELKAELSGRGYTVAKKKAA